MLELKTKKELATEAFKLAAGQELVRYHNVTYVPADYETRAYDVVPAPERTVWLPMTRRLVQNAAAQQFDTLFGSDGELSAFEFMVAQSSTQLDQAVSSLLVSTPGGLRELTEQGQLIEVSGEFRPNALRAVLNEEAKHKDRVMAVISGWLDSDEEARSLLQHLATSLAPGWSAVKYVLLLGEGRNGKSLLLKMLASLFGSENVSSVSRQAIAEQSAVVTSLNGSLLNIVYDGRAEYVKDSGTEKSLVAGEPVEIRRLYESSSTTVQTNALYLEGLQREPKTSDKSSALQKRLVRYQFPNVYELNHGFERSMLTPESLGAFLSLLIDHYVTEDEVAVKLAPTAKAIELQLDQMYTNNLGLQFLKWYEETDALGVTGLLGQTMTEVAAAFKSWRLKEMDMGNWSEPDVIAMLQPLTDTERRSVREAGKVRKVRVLVALKAEAKQYIETLRGDEEADDQELITALVED